MLFAKKINIAGRFKLLVNFYSLFHMYKFRMNKMKWSSSITCNTNSIKNYKMHFRLVLQKEKGQEGNRHWRGFC